MVTIAPHTWAQDTSEVASTSTTDASTSTINDESMTDDATNDQPIDTEQWAGADAGFLSRDRWLGLPEDQRPKLPVGCRGVWVTPIPPAPDDDTRVAFDEAPLTATADYGYYHPTQGAELSGKVRISQPNRLLEADRMEIDASQTVAKATGQVRLSEAGLVSLSDQLTYNLKTQSGEFGQTQYISQALQAHGQADALSRDERGITILKNAEYSTCEPDRRVWNIKAKRLELNNQTGRGVARQTKLYIRDVPVLSLPWFDFPIDDRRSSGFLIPRGGYTNDGGLDLSIPYYLNLAPNYDVTLTPRLLSRRHAMLEGEGRYLTANWGGGMLSGGYLPQDPLYNDADRKRASLKYDWQINTSLRSNINLNYVSDKDYFTDLGTDPLVSNQLNQERSVSLFYEKGIAGLTGLLRVQKFQTVDPSTPDIDRPYARLPQLLINYQQGQPLGWQYELQHDSAYFKKEIRDGSALESSGVRVYHQAAARYQWRNAWGYVTPEASVRNITTQYDQDTQNQNGISHQDARHDVTVPQFTLDSGLVFERYGAYLQTVEPRLYYAYSPYQNQDDAPNFDTTTASPSYSQLFRPYRFVGHDRLDDNHFVSTGVTHRLYNPEGMELLSVSVGQSYYLADRRVRLKSTDPMDGRRTSGPALEVASQLTDQIRVDSASLWMANGQNLQNIHQLQYQQAQGQLYQVGYFERHAVTQLNQKSLRQVTAGLVQPLYNQWRAFGYLQYDLQNTVARDGLFGLDYDACCWRIALYGRSYYNDLDDPNTNKPRRIIMAEVTLKGLAGLSGNLSSLLRQKILGYTQVETSWNSR